VFVLLQNKSMTDLSKICRKHKIDANIIRKIKQLIGTVHQREMYNITLQFANMIINTRFYEISNKMLSKLKKTVDNYSNYYLKPGQKYVVVKIIKESELLKNLHFPFAVKNHITLRKIEILKY
jgi:hypothetical protein